MVAIMGATGSGKTSLLNILAKRHKENKRCSIEGEVKINNSLLKSKEFG